MSVSPFFQRTTSPVSDSIVSLGVCPASPVHHTFNLNGSEYWKVWQANIRCRLPDQFENYHTDRYQLISLVKSPTTFISTPFDNIAGWPEDTGPTYFIILQIQLDCYSNIFNYVHPGSCILIIQVSILIIQVPVYWSSRYMYINHPGPCILIIQVTVYWSSRFLYIDYPGPCILIIQVPVYWSSRFLYIDYPGPCILVIQVPVYWSSRFLYINHSGPCILIIQVPVFWSSRFLCILIIQVPVYWSYRSLYIDHSAPCILIIQVPEFWSSRFLYIDHMAFTISISDLHLMFIVNPTVQSKWVLSCDIVM